ALPALGLPLGCGFPLAGLAGADSGLGPLRLGGLLGLDFGGGVVGPRGGCPYSPGHATQPPPVRISWMVSLGGTGSRGWAPGSGPLAVAGCRAGAAWEVGRTPRSKTMASTAMPAATAALMPAVTCRPEVNACRAAASSAAPASAGSSWATPTAPPSVSWAAAAAWLGVAAGGGRGSSAREGAPPVLPRIPGPQ